MFKIIPGVLLVSLGLSGLAWAEESKIKEVKKYVVNIEAQDYVPYAGRFKGEFPQGFKLAPGSGLTVKEVHTDGSIDFWGLTDRGPNGDTPEVKTANGSLAPSKMFLVPGYSPSLALINLSAQGGARVTEVRKLQVGGQPASGLPIPSGVGSTGEVALGDRLETLPGNPAGLDPEGVAIDQKGDFWICDEYGPFLVQFDGQTLNEKKRVGPGQGLPEILGKRVPNRGFEGLALTPSWNLMAVVQSVLDVGKTKNTALFARLVEYNPKNGATRMFAYPVPEDFTKTGAMKIGDIVALQDNKFVLIEQGKAGDRLVNRLVIVDIEKATDLTDKQLPDGRDLEFAASKEELSSVVKMAERRVLVDFREMGWEFEKAEGLALLGSDKLVLINDNDFGLAAGLTKGQKMDDCQIENGQIQAKNGSELPPETTVSLKQNNEPTALWVLEFKRSLDEY